MKNKLLILFAFLTIGLMSCDLGDNPDVGGTATQALAGEYFLQLFSEPGGDLFADYTMWTISNTAANTADRIRMTDHENLFVFSSELNCDVEALTFWADSTSNLFFEGPPTAEPPGTPLLPLDTFALSTSGSYWFMRIEEGRLLLDQAHVPSGTNADSIAFYATGGYFAKKYNVVGYRPDTISTDPLEIITVNVFEFVKDTFVDDGPYFLSGYRRTGFLEDEH